MAKFSAVAFQHVSTDPPIECLREMATLWKAGKLLTLEFLSCTLTVAAWLAAWTAAKVNPDDKEDNPSNVFGATSDAPDERMSAVMVAAKDCFTTMGGDPANLVVAGPVTNAIVARMVKQALIQAMQKLKEHGFDWIINQLEKL